jgi:hypothetical protein
VTEPNNKLPRSLQFIGLFFALAAIFVIALNLLDVFSWDLIAGIFFLSYLLLCGLSFGVAGLMAENPERRQKLFTEWLIGTVAILIWVLVVYAIL